MRMNLSFLVKEGIFYWDENHNRRGEIYMSQIKSSNLGYPRIGENREWKKALE